MGVHHAWGRIYKDVYQRYYAMNGHELRYQNGFDCQGLWVEVEVEKALGFKSKRDIESYGIEKFVQKCKDRVIKYSKIQSEQSIRLGYWMDWDNSYYTMSDENNYTIWAFLKKCYDRGWIYKGHDVMPWCSRCGTALSEHEIATEGYKEIEHTSIYIRFPLKDRPNEYLMVWTTTPWTLTSNVLAAVHPDFTYVKVKQDNDIYYMIKNLTDVVLKTKGKYEILEEMKGKALEGWEYTGPFDDLDVQQGIKHKIILWEEVSDTTGSGIVHIAPGCGKEDFILGKEYNVPAIAPLDDAGNYIEGFNWLTGRNVEEVTDEILMDLKKRGILYKKDKILHRYPVCWRCGSELVFRLVDEWYISMDELRYEIMEITKQINWIPSYGMERELDWLKNMHDWMISKKRYWGLALPIYVCDECDHFEVIGSETELKERAIEGWDEFKGHSPHKPYIDKVKIQCPKCSAKASRIPDVGNPWLDAGIVPYSTMGYRNDNEYWKQWFPPDFITECFPGQFRNWFYTLLAMSTVMENKIPFKTLLGHALVRDEKGEEMHKSAGNSIPFEEAADKMGVDVMRWLFTSNNPINNINFGYGPGKEVRKKLLTLWNSYSFLITYANVDNINPAELDCKYEQLTELDKWILARLHQLIKSAHKEIKKYNVMALCKATEQFLDDLSNWYIRRSRRRFWKSDTDGDKVAAYYTLYEVLTNLIKILAPIIPFLSEYMYQNLIRKVDKNAPHSIHLCSYPEADEKLIDENLIKEISLVIRVVSMGRRIRNTKQLKVRQPLAEILVRPKEEEEGKILKKHEMEILTELNIKKLNIVESEDEYIVRIIQPDWSLLGPKFGKNVSIIKKALEDENIKKNLLKAVNAGLNYTLNIDAGSFILTPEDIPVTIMQGKKDYACTENMGYWVALKTSLTDELINEGIARDFVRSIQSDRKEGGLEVTNRINLYYTTSDEIHQAIETHKDYIIQETLIINLQRAENLATLETDLLKKSNTLFIEGSSMTNKGRIFYILEKAYIKK